MARALGFCLFDTAIGPCGIAWNEHSLAGVQLPEADEASTGPAHLMLIDIARPLNKGERFPLMVRFEKAGELELEVEVQEIGARHSRH